jgi:hypothetical protein
MTDQEYVQELSRLAAALDADEISTHEWRIEMARLRGARSETREKGALSDPH